MERKGISPIIATVLLIAFTISVGAIVGAWVTGFSRGKSDEIGRNAVETVDCAVAGIAFGRSDIGTTQILISNVGQIPLDSLRISIQTGTGQNATIGQYTAFGVNATDPLKPTDRRIISNGSMNITAGDRVSVISTRCQNAQDTEIK